MLCPKCHTESRVIITYSYTDGIRRRHACQNPECRHRFNTAQVLYGKPFAVCKGKKMKKIDGKWVTTKTRREMDLAIMRAKRARYTKEERLAFIRRSLNLSNPATPAEAGEADHG